MLFNALTSLTMLHSIQLKILHGELHFIFIFFSLEGKNAIVKRFIIGLGDIAKNVYLDIFPKS